jgi:fibro-slime domain-containing protein
VYTFDAFHAERHTSQSNFRMETSIDCLETIK